MFKKNDRVRYSAEGNRTVINADPDRLGTVSGNPRDPDLVSVCWDKTKYSRRYHSTFIEKTLN